MFAWASLGMVLISTFTFVLGTFPGNSLNPHFNPHYTRDNLCRVPERGGDRATPTLPGGRSSHGRCRFEPHHQKFLTCVLIFPQHWFANNKMCNISENGAVLFFLVEYIIRFLSSTSNLLKLICDIYDPRFICSPRKFRFFKQPMNLVDFCAIIPFLLDLVIGGLQVANPLSFGETISYHIKVLSPTLSPLMRVTVSATHIKS